MTEQNDPEPEPEREPLHPFAIPDDTEGPYQPEPDRPEQ